jgi:hypothetical protein
MPALGHPDHPENDTAAEPAAPGLESALGNPAATKNTCL